MVISSRKITNINGKAYSNKTNELLETQPKDLDKNKKQVEKDLEMSDNVLNGDLFRFYKTLISKKLTHLNMNIKLGQKVTKNNNKESGT